MPYTLNMNDISASTNASVRRVSKDSEYSLSRSNSDYSKELSKYLAIHRHQLQRDDETDQLDLQASGECALGVGNAAASFYYTNTQNKHLFYKALDYADDHDDNDDDDGGQNGNYEYHNVHVQQQVTATTTTTTTNMTDVSTECNRRANHGSCFGCTSVVSREH